MKTTALSCRRLRLAVASLVVSIGPSALAAEADDSAVGDPFPLINCVVTETQLDNKALVFQHQGREIRTCCLDCEDDMKKDFDSWNRKIDDRIIQQQESFYPLNTCVVDGKSLEESGVVDFVLRNRHFLLCSFECQEKLEAMPERYFARLNQAVIEKQRSDYPLTTCIVSGKPLGEAAVDHVAGNQLVRLFDSEQLGGFDRNPGKYLSELRRLWRKKPPSQSKQGGPEHRPAGRIPD